MRISVLEMVTPLVPGRNWPAGVQWLTGLSSVIP